MEWDTLEFLENDFAFMIAVTFLETAAFPLTIYFLSLSSSHFSSSVSSSSVELSFSLWFHSSYVIFSFINN